MLQIIRLNNVSNSKMNVYGALVEQYCWGASEVPREKSGTLPSVQYTSHMDGLGTFIAKYQ